MSSAAHSHSDARQRRVSIRHSRATSSTETSSAAEVALQQILDRRLRRREGRPPSAVARTFGSARSGVVRSIDRCGLPQWVFRVGVLGFATVVLGYAVCAVMHSAPSAERRHAVTGTLSLNGRPLPDSIVEFHRIDEAEGGDRLVEVSYTDAEGHFTFGASMTPGLPAGTYAVVTRGRRRVVRHGEPELVHLPLPKAYTNPVETPLKVSVSEDTSGVRLAVRK